MIKKMRVSYFIASIMFVIFLISSQVNVFAQNDEVIDLESLEEIESLSKTIYGKLVILDNNDINITQIVKILNAADDYYEESKKDLNNGDVEKFRRYVTNYIELLRNIDNSVDVLITNAASKKFSNTFQSLFLSILYVVLGYITWKFIVKNHKNKILTLKPVVNNDEFE